jgi:hypothetical protein
MNRLYPRLPPCALLVGILATLLSLVATAVAQRPGGRGDRQRPEAGRSLPAPSFSEILANAQGILFVNGEYVPLPCAIRVESGQLLVNDLSVTSKLDQPTDRPRFWRATPTQQAQELGMHIAGQLVQPQIVVVLENQPVVNLSSPPHQRELLRKLARLDANPAIVPVALTDQLPPDFDREVWDQWIADFTPTPAFVTRVTAYIEIFDRAGREAQDAISATRRLYDFSYPLSLIGMVASVLGFGHLLSHRPPVGAKSLDIDASPLTLRMVTYSLLLVVLYSALDLTWTILAYQAGQMLELNPLGSRLIEDPLKLIAFKVGATAMSVGLLFYLRKYCKAQLAAWWICLILTLLTARWLMMSSMFVA